MNDFNPWRLTEMRHFRMLSTEDVALKLGGVDELAVRSWEQGTAVPSPVELDLLGFLLDTPPARWTMPGDESIITLHTSLVFHIGFEEQDICSECGRSSEFMCDQRGVDGKYNCSIPLCVRHARAAHGGDYCKVHVGNHTEIMIR